MTSASLSPAVKVSCLVTSCNGSNNDKTDTMEGEICFADTDPAKAPVLPCTPCFSGTVPALSPVLYKCVQDKIL